jgi:predicted deacetylase
MQRQNIQTFKAYNYTILIKQKIEEKRMTVETGTDYEHPKAEDYLTQQLKELLTNNKNDCTQTFLPSETEMSETCR